MSGKTPGAALSVAALAAERDARRSRDREAEDQLQRRKQEQLADFRKRLDNFQLTDAVVEFALDRIRHVFELGETEMMIASFPTTLVPTTAAQSSTLAPRRSTSRPRRNWRHGQTNQNGW